MAPTYPVSGEQQRAWQLRICEHLGIDPAIVSHLDWETAGEDGKVTLTAHLPADVLVALFNGEPVPRP